MENKVMLTQEQQNVVNFDGGNLLVSASAGSGKTKVLIQRAVRLIVEKNCKLENMLICTFTNAAALQMKNRLKAELNNLLQNEKDDNEQKYLMEQIDEINLANISTLHSFCSNYIRQYFYKLGIDPNFALIEESQCNYLKKQAFEKTLNYFYNKNDEEFDLLFDMFNKSRNLDNFKKNIFAISEFLKSKIDAQSWIASTIEQCYSTDFSKNICIEVLINQVKEYFKFFQKQLNNLKLESEMLNCEKLLEFIEPKNIFVDNVLSINDFDKMRIFLDIKNNFPRLELKANATMEEKEVLIKLQNLKTNLNLNIKTLNSMLCYGSLNELKSNLELSKKTTLKLFEVVNMFDEIYSQLKSKNNQFDFNDLEKQMVKLLEQSEVANDLQKQFKYVFVDEYQDINEVQEKIISTISQGNAFMVGDVKQSIYLFRNCEPKIFVDKFYLYQKNPQLGNVQKLNKNFRSDKYILEFCNFIFNKIMTEKSCMVNYLKDAKFIYDDNNNDKVSVDVKFIDMANDEKQEVLSNSIYSVKDDEVEKEDNNKIQYEAMIVANEIRKALQLKITDEETKQKRNVEFKDIAILLGVMRNVAQPFAETLKKCGIPTTLSYQFKLYKTNEVLGVLNYLSFLNNQQNDFALLSVLKGNFCNLSNNEIAKIRLKIKNEIFFYKAVEQYIESVDDNISNKIKQLFKEIYEFKIKCIYLNLFDLVQEIYEYYELKQKCLNKEVYNNLQLFLESLKNVKFNNLTEFLDYIFNFAIEEKFETKISEGNNSVTVSSIHASKGLEYPVVILANANREFDKQSIRSEVLLNKDYGLGVKFYDVVNRFEKNTVARSALAKCIDRDETSEKIRLLYVALTRAKNKLIIVGSGKIKRFESFKDEFNILKAKSNMEFLLGALDNSNLTTLKETGRFKNDIATFEVIDKDNISTPNKEYEIADIIKVSKDFNKIIDIYWNFEYPNKNGNILSLKNTVTAMAMFEENKNIYRTKHFDILTNDKMNEEEDYLAIGTAYHKVMEMCVVNKVFSIENVKEIISALIQNNKEMEKYYLQVNVQKIFNAINNIKKFITETSKVLCEQKFIMFVPHNEIVAGQSNNKILVQGIIDLIIENENNIYLIDYKTTKLNSEQDFKDKYKKQLDIYELAIIKHFQNNKKPIKKIIYSFHKDSAIIV